MAISISTNEIFHFVLGAYAHGKNIRLIVAWRNQMAPEMLATLIQVMFCRSTPSLLK